MSYLTSNTNWWIDDATADAIELASHPIYTYTASVNTDWHFVRVNNDGTIDEGIPLAPEIARLHAEQHPIDPDWKDLI